MRDRTHHLKCASSEAAVLFLRHREGKKLIARIKKQHGKGKALSILAHKIGRAVFDMLSRGTVFSIHFGQSHAPGRAYLSGQARLVPRLYR